MKNKLIVIFPYLLVCFILLFIYKSWFLVTDVIGGDWPYYFPRILSNFTFPPLSWVSWRGNGFGGIDVAYALHIFEHFTTLGTTSFGIPWFIISKITWFALFLLLTVWSIQYLYSTVFPRSNNWSKAIAILIYGVNSYVLLLTSGGQMGYALGYAVAPLVCGLYIRSLSLKKITDIIKNIILTAIALGFLFMIDIRVAYIVLLIWGLYSLFNFFFAKSDKLKTIIFFFIPLLLAGLLNLSWILPLLFFKQNIVNEVSQTYSSIESLRFFSFADFSHAFGFLHPNWPENIFGKVLFMNPKFLFLPLLAFGSLLFITKRNNIVFFALLAFIGIFLAKGTQEPFGNIYSWFFEHIPGFVMFRDPTKFYLLIALSYAILIPFTLSKIKEKFLPKYIFLIPFIFIVAYLFILPEAITGHLGGTFKQQTIPYEYKQLAAYLDKQPEFFRTLWFPRQSRFTYSSSTHRVIEALPFYNATSSAQIIAQIKRPEASQVLRERGIKYVIVPYDTLGEIFQGNRKYNHKEYQETINELRKISWLKEKTGFGNIIVFETPSYNDHFSLKNDGKIVYQMKDTTSYEVRIATKEKNTLTFTENYNPSWIGKINGKEVSPTKNNDGYMEFILPQIGTYNIAITFIQQNYYVTGFLISTMILVILIITFIVLQYKNFFIYLKNTI